MNVTPFQSIIEISPFVSSLLINTYGDNYVQTIESKFYNIQKSREYISPSVKETFESESIYEYHREKTSNTTNITLLAVTIVFFGKLGTAEKTFLVGTTGLVIILFVLCVRLVMNRLFSELSPTKYRTKAFMRFPVVGRVSKLLLAEVLLYLIPVVGIIYLNHWLL
jgi:hypothetical protein